MHSKKPENQPKKPFRLLVPTEISRKKSENRAGKASFFAPARGRLRWGGLSLLLGLFFFLGACGNVLNLTEERYSNPYEGIDAPIDEEAIARALEDRPDARTNEFFEEEVGLPQPRVYDPAPNDIPVTLERVRYGHKCFGLCTFRDNENFPQWPAQGVSKDNRKATYISVINKPAEPEVRDLVLLSAGQQGIDIFPGRGTENTVTGQGSHWRKGWKKGSSISYSIDRRSLAAKLTELDWFSTNSTFFALIFDAAFYYATSTDEKKDMENAYASWLLSHAEAANIDRIFLAGASRGGCLTARLAQNIRQRSGYDQVEIYFIGFDAVCNKSQGELSTEREAVFNEFLNPDGCSLLGQNCWFAWQGNMADAFANTERLRMFQIVGGGNVNFGDNLAGNPRAWSDNEGARTLDWYDQLWVPYGHKEIGRSYNEEIVASTVDAGLNWLEQKLTEDGYL